MQNLAIDTGMKEYLINNRAVLRFLRPELM